MYRICQTEQSSKRQRAIENGFLTLLCKKRYEDISISDLCAYLDIPRKTFYRYFSGKDGALYALLDHTMMDFQLQNDSAAPQEESALGDLRRFFLFWYDHKALLDALERSGLSGILVERATSFALQEGMMPRHMLSWDPSYQRIALSFATCGLLSMVILWHHQGFTHTPQEMARIATTILTHPLLQI